MRLFESLQRLRFVTGCYSLADHDSPAILAAQMRLGLANWQDCNDYQLERGDEAVPIFAAPLLPIENDTTAEREWHLWVQFALERFAQLNTDEPFGLAVLSSGLTVAQVESILTNNAQLSVVATSVHDLLPAWEAAMAQPESPQRWIWLSVHAGCSLEALDNNDRLATRNHPEGHIAADALVWCEFSVEASQQALVQQVEELNWASIETQPVTALSALRAACPHSVQAHWLHNGGFSKDGVIERYKAQQFTEFDLAKQPLELEEQNMQQALGDIGVCALPVQLCLQSYFQRMEKPPVFNTYHEQQQRIGWWLTE